MTRPVELEAMPRGQACTVCFRWCSVLIASEDLFIGGRRTRRTVHYDELDGKELTLPVEGGPAVLQSEGACHGAIRRMLMAVLPHLMLYEGGHRTEEWQWDEFVPAGLVESIVVVAGAAGGGSYACHVWMHVNLTSVFDEAKALLLSCEAAEATTDAAVRRASEGGAAMCPICMEGLAGGGRITGLAGCSHAFHRCCILEWFHTAPTCPSCRRDMMQYLDPRVRAYMTAVAAIDAYERREGEVPQHSIDGVAARRRGAGARGLGVRHRTSGIPRRRSGRRGVDVLDALVEPMFRGQGGPGM